MKTTDEKDKSGLFLGSEPLDGGAHERQAKADTGGKDLGGHGPKDSNDDDATDKGADGTDGDSDGVDKGDSDGVDKGDGGADSRDADGRD